MTTQETKPIIAEITRTGIIAGKTNDEIIADIRRIHVDESKTIEATESKDGKPHYYDAAGKEIKLSKANVAWYRTKMNAAAKQPKQLIMQQFKAKFDTLPEDEQEKILTELAKENFNTILDKGDVTHTMTVFEDVFKIEEPAVNETSEPSTETIDPVLEEANASVADTGFAPVETETKTESNVKTLKPKSGKKTNKK